MNILFLLHSYPKIGGIEMVTQTVSRYLGHRHNLYYLARIADPTLPADRERCFYFPPKHQQRDAEYYNDLIHQLHIDVVINQGPFLPFTPILDNPDRDPKVRIFTFDHFTPGHEFERIKWVWMSEQRPLPRLFKRLKTALGLNTLQYNPERYRRQYRRLYDLSERTVVLAPEYIPMFRDAYRLPETSKLANMPLASRYACDSPALSDILARKRRTILFVGRLELESKRVDRLLAIWHSIPDKAGWTLKIAGDGPHRPELERLVREQGIESVEFLGAQHNLQPLYEEAAAVVLTSTYEGYGLCFVEGIQFGAIPLSFDVSPGNRPLFRAIAPELLVQPFDLNAYAAQLRQIMTDEAWRQTLAEKALRKAADYSQECIGRLWDELLA